MGAEEQKHADLWRNVLLFTRARTPHWIEEYEGTLRTNEWRLPWDDPLHMSWYVVVQERATQVTYQNTAAIARGEATNPVFTADTDPVLARVAQTVAINEAAHYNFFLEAAGLQLYHDLARSLEALLNVLQHFAMPSLDLLPDQSRFTEAASGRRVYAPGNGGRYARNGSRAARHCGTGRAGRRGSPLAPGPGRQRAPA